MNRWSNHKPNLSAMPETPMVKAQKRQNKKHPDWLWEMDHYTQLKR
jgi:hypothetical protein